jgi:hydrogenase maturation protease
MIQPADSPPDTAAVRRVLVACVGNIFLGDDGFGVAVAERLRGRRFAAGVQVVDFGIRGMDLAYALLDPYEALILVDAAPRGKAPGTLTVLDATPPATDERVAGARAGHEGVETHSMDPVKVLHYARALGAAPVRTFIVACEPERPAADDDELRMGLSEPVQAAVGEAATLVETLVQQCCSAASH